MRGIVRELQKVAMDLDAAKIMVVRVPKNGPNKVMDLSDLSEHDKAGLDPVGQRLVELLEEGVITDAIKLGMRDFSRDLILADEFTAGCEKLPEGPMRDNCEKKKKEAMDLDAAGGNLQIRTNKGLVELPSNELVEYFNPRAGESRIDVAHRVLKKGIKFKKDGKWYEVKRVKVAMDLVSALDVEEFPDVGRWKKKVYRGEVRYLHGKYKDGNYPYSVSFETNLKDKVKAEYYIDGGLKTQFIKHSDVSSKVGRLLKNIEKSLA